MKGIKKTIWLWCTVIFLAGCATVQVPVLQYQRLAVLDFKAPPGQPQIGAKAANIMISELLQGRQYELIERSEVDQILKEHKLTTPDPTDTAALKKIGGLLKADALIVGTVSTYRVEEHKGTKAVKKVLTEYTKGTKTGEKNEITIGEKGRIMPGRDSKGTYEEKTVIGKETEKTEEVKAKTVLVDQIQVAKRGTVSVDFRMFDVTTGKILQAKSQSDTAYYIATTPQEALYLPGNDEVLDTILNNIVRWFSQWVSPKAMGMTRSLHKGKDPLTKLGVTYAKRGLWEEAIAQWESVLNANPHNPYAHNNLAVAYERQGKYKAAIAEYQKALKGDPTNSTFMDNLARARKVLSSRESAK